MTRMYVATTLYPERGGNAVKVDTLIEGGWYAIDQYPFSCKFVKVLDSAKQLVAQSYPVEKVSLDKFTTGNHVRLQLVPFKMADDFESRYQHWSQFGGAKR
jgi:hypothetical protein